MHEDLAALFAFNRWANAKMLEACRKLSPEQYAAEPVPGWAPVRATVYHIAIVTEGWLRALAEDPDPSFPSEAEVATVDDAARVLDRAYRILDSLLANLTLEQLALPRTLRRRGRTAVLPPWVVLRHVVTTRPTTAARWRPSSSGSASSSRRPTSSIGRSSRCQSKREGC